MPPLFITLSNAERLNRFPALNNVDLSELIRKIKKKPGLRGVADEFIKTLIESKLKKYSISHSPKDMNLLVKEIRAELRMHTGRFHTKLLPESTEEMLKFHTSTRERQPHYDVLRKFIHELTPKSILDVGCGLNPLVLAASGITYYACDINEEEINSINEHFRKNALPGKAFIADVRTHASFPSVDLCLMLKLLDIIDTKGHANAESLLKRIEAKRIIVSFSTRKLSGRRMNRPRRQWFERMLERLHYAYERVQTDNEVFYKIVKS